MFYLKSLPNMKNKCFATILMLFVCIAAFSQVNKSKKKSKQNIEVAQSSDKYSPIHINDFSTRPGETVKVLVNLNNTSYDVLSAEFDLYLPYGVVIDTDKNKRPKISIGTRLDDHKILVKKNNDGSTKIGIYSLTNAIFRGSEGDILVIYLRIDENISLGNHSLQLKNQILTDENIKSLMPPNVTTKLYVGTETDINSIIESKKTQNIFDLQGRRSNESSESVYILDGEKIINK